MKFLVLGTQVYWIITLWFKKVILKQTQKQHYQQKPNVKKQFILQIQGNRPNEEVLNYSKAGQVHQVHYDKLSTSNSPPQD